MSKKGGHELPGRVQVLLWEPTQYNDHQKQPT